MYTADSAVQRYHLHTVPAVYQQELKTNIQWKLANNHNFTCTFFFRCSLYNRAPKSNICDPLSIVLLTFTPTV